MWFQYTALGFAIVATILLLLIFWPVRRSSQRYLVSQLEFLQGGKAEILEKDYSDLPPGEYYVVSFNRAKETARLFFYGNQGPNVLTAPCFNVTGVPKNCFTKWPYGKPFRLPIAD